jgi:hypothetical protein
MDHHHGAKVESIGAMNGSEATLVQHAMEAVGQRPVGC